MIKKLLGLSFCLTVGLATLSLEAAFLKTPDKKLNAQIQPSPEFINNVIEFMHNKK
ncbi:MAG: hypothetical protein WCT20_05500 [Candidatus Babeliales bacterium]